MDGKERRCVIFQTESDAVRRLRCDIRAEKRHHAAYLRQTQAFFAALCGMERRIAAARIYHIAAVGPDVHACAGEKIAQLLRCKGGMLLRCGEEGNAKLAALLHGRAAGFGGNRCGKDRRTISSEQRVCILHKAAVIGRAGVAHGHARLYHSAAEGRIDAEIGGCALVDKQNNLDAGKSAGSSAASS